MSLPVGELVSSEPAQFPPGVDLNGKYTWLTRLKPSHSDDLFKHLGGESNFWRWTYMMTSGFPSIEQCREYISGVSNASDPFFYSVHDGPADRPDTEVVGMMSYMASVPAHRRIEIGSVILGEKLAKSRQATEAFYLFIKHAIEDLGYQRVEWKANHLNAPSRAAAERLGFTFEGVFR
jgi:RimJ/RimL family protein N-acetyltransferase